MRTLLLLAASTIFYSSEAFSQCPAALQTLDVQIKVEPIQYDYSHTSQSMQRFKNAKAQAKNNHLLGLYNPNTKYSIHPYAESVWINRQTTCSSVTSLIIKITINPTIYISKEAQQFECTRNRVHQHELLHHNYETTVMLRAKPIIENLARKHFQQPFTAESPNEIRNILSQRNSALIENIYQYVTYTTQVLHSQIDNPDNYKRESKVCSDNENLYLSRILNQKVQISAYR